MRGTSTWRPPTTADQSIATATTSRVRIGSATVRRAWIAYLAVGLAALVAYFVALDQAVQDTAYNLCGTAAVGAIVVGTWLWRPARRRPWVMLAAGVALQVVGDVVATLLTGPDGVEPFPSLADAAYLAGTAAVAFGIVEFARGGNREHDRVAWVDALVVAAAASIFVWVFVIRHEIASSADAPSGIVAAAYPFLDIVQIAVVAHLLLGGRRTLAVILLGLSVVASLVADLVFAMVALDGTYEVGHLVDAGWLIGYVALGTAALHPSMAIAPASSATEEASQWTLTRPRLVLLAGAATTGPLVIALQAMRGEPPDTFAIVIGLSVVYLLILGRVVLGLTALQGALQERSALATELAEQASHDALTSLGNRRLFLARLEAALARPQPGRAAAVVYLDLDRVKAINDTEGHEAGDAAIVAVAERLRSGFRSADCVARLGGDEFGILLASATESEALAVAARVNTLLEEPVPIGDHAVRITASVGAARATPGDTVHDVLRNADQAMYRAKVAGGGSYVRHSVEIQAESAERVQLQADLTRAVERNEWALHYQPIVDLENGAIVGLEALVRWEHPTRGLLLPGAFLGLAEEVGLMVPLGRWVLREAIRQASEWQRLGLLRRALMIDINVSARQLADPMFVHEVAAAVAGTGMGAGRLAVELTETELIGDPEAVGRRLAVLRKGGVQVVIDDFGTAYASMSYLANLPVDGLKIDRQFVSELEYGAGPGRALVSSMVGLARQLGIWAVAEGVETETQARALRELGCPYAQGYLFGRPLPADRVASILASGAIEVPSRVVEVERRAVRSA